LSQDLKDPIAALFVSTSNDTPVVQQIHLTASHGIFDEIQQTKMREGSRK
jgi:hypothetical protein